jgi:hypothetical protein
VIRSHATRNVTCEATPAGWADWYIGYDTTVRLPDDLSEGKRARVLARCRVAAALRGLKGAAR